MVALLVGKEGRFGEQPFFTFMNNLGGEKSKNF